MSFPCVRCGLCCSRAGEVLDLQHLADESGRCRYLTRERTCSIYEHRPLVCRVDELGSHLPISKEGWYRINLTVCNYFHVEAHGSPLEKEGEICQHGLPKLKTSEARATDRHAVLPASRPADAPPADH